MDIFYNYLYYSLFVVYIQIEAKPLFIFKENKANK